MTEQPEVEAPERPDLLDILRPRRSRGQLLVGALCALVGFALAVTVSVQRSPRALERTSQENLVRILSDLTQRSERLRAEVSDLQAEHDALVGSQGQSDAAIADARRRADALRILAGTTPATGPGVELTIRDPRKAVPADALLNAVQELRDAGAEAIQIGGVRIVASSYFRDGPRGITIDGAALEAPYRVVAIGDSHTMSDALGIPGGVLDTIEPYEGADVDVRSQAVVTVDALKKPQAPRYARPTTPASDD